MRGREVKKEIGEDRTRWKDRARGKKETQRDRWGERKRQRRGVCAGEAKRGEAWKEPEGGLP